MNDKHQRLTRDEVQRRIREGIKTVLEDLMEEEMTEHLQAQHRQRTEQRRGERNEHRSALQLASECAMFRIAHRGRMLHRILISSLFLLLLVTTAPKAEGEEKNGQQTLPNIILLMADDLGWGDVGFNGNARVRTPHLDAMARASLRFNRFYAAAPVCSPTRGSVLTGRHPYRYGIFFANVGHLPAEEINLAELLRQKGYRTGHFGKWHLGTLTRTEHDSNRGGPQEAEHYAPPWDHGFDVAFSTEAKVPTYDPMVKPRSVERQTWWDPVADPANAEPYGTAYWYGEGDKATENLAGDDSRVIMDRALSFIRQAARSDSPFFAVIWFHTPHLPVVAGELDRAPYRGRDSYTQHYYGSVTALDRQIGRLRQALRHLGVAEHTLVAFTSDNGPEHLFEEAPGSAHGLRGAKRSLFEGGIRVPGLIEWPANIRPGRETDVPAVTSDYLPTILELLGIALPDGRPLDGVSLLPLIEGQMVERPRPIAFESRGQLALVGNQYKLIHVPAERSASERRPIDADEISYRLYDLQTDPSERRNLSDERPQVVREMAERLRQWRASVAASLEGEDYPAEASR